MRALLVLLVFLMVPAVAVAQDNATSNTTSNTTEANATSNETPVQATPATPAGPLEITIVGHSEGAANYWTLEGQTARNPTIEVEPGQKIIFHIKAASGSHNVKIADLPTSAIFDETSDVITIEWTAPATPGSVKYICLLHGAAMSGTIKVGAASSGPASGSGAPGGDIIGETIDIPGCPGGKVPAVIGEGVTGAPTMDDYVKKCQSGDATEARAASGADYVIPVSFGLVAVGIVAVVWVHKSYKP